MLIQGDSAAIPLPDKSIHAVVTSPPYWGLRKYAGEQGRGIFPDLGLEKTPQEHIENLVAIMREIRRVLRDDGVVWLNYGDCYDSGGLKNPEKVGGFTGERIRAGVKGIMDSRPREITYGQGNLMLMPHRIAIALQDDGWIVRNDLIWFKRNPMPESVAGWRWERSREEKSRIKGGGNQNTNLASMDAGISGGLDKVEWEYGDDYILKKGSWRHTRAHEYVFQLVKKMGYYCNQEAVREIYTEPINRWGGDKLKEESEKHSKYLDMMGISPSSALRAGRPLRPNTSGRNPRSVLDIPTSPYKGAHYATFPPNLIAPLIRASCPRRACPECGQAWAPVVEKSRPPEELYTKNRNPDESISRMHRVDGEKVGSGQKVQDWLDANPPAIKSYRPTCECGHDEYVPGTVLDPFVGSGTTVRVAKDLLRRGIGLDISMEYLDEQAKIRTRSGTPTKQLDDLPLFAKLES